MAFWGLGAIPPKIFEKGVKKMSRASCVYLFVCVCMYVNADVCVNVCVCLCVWLLSLAFALEGPWGTEGRASLH